MRNPGLFNIEYIYNKRSIGTNLILFRVTSYEIEFSHIWLFLFFLKKSILCEMAKSMRKNSNIMRVFSVMRLVIGETLACSSIHMRGMFLVENFPAYKRNYLHRTYTYCTYDICWACTWLTNLAIKLIFLEIFGESDRVLSFDGNIPISHFRLNFSNLMSLMRRKLILFKCH